MSCVLAPPKLPEEIFDEVMNRVQNLKGERVQIFLSGLVNTLYISVKTCVPEEVQSVQIVFSVLKKS